MATYLLDDVSDDTYLTDVGVLSGCLDIIVGQVWVFQKYWSSEWWTLSNPMHFCLGSGTDQMRISENDH